jgi:hypothetical protein
VPRGCNRGLLDEGRTIWQSTGVEKDGRVVQGSGLENLIKPLAPLKSFKPFTCDIKRLPARWPAHTPHLAHAIADRPGTKSGTF